MNYFKCINEVKPSYVVDAEPQFSETVLYENQTSAAENTITLSEDYHNFDIIKFYCYDTDNGNSSYYATPDMLDHMITDNTPYINLNVIGTYHYITYKINSNTQLTRSAQRVLYVTKIVGLNCSNGTLVETKVYSRTRANTWVTIETELNLFEFDMILAQTTTGSWDECNLNDTIFLCSNSKYLGNNDIKNQLNQWRVSYYSNFHVINLTEHTMSSGMWYYVAGLKFIPNWDYYIENIDSSYPSPINTQLKLASEENSNKDWEISFKCSRIDQASALINFGTQSNSNGTLFGGGLDTWSYSGNGFRWIGNRSASNCVVSTLNKEFYISKKNNVLRIYVDNQLIKEVTYGSYTSYSENPLVLGKIDWKGSDLYNIVHWNYFGFRWLS